MINYTIWWVLSVCVLVLELIFTQTLFYMSFNDSSSHQLRIRKQTDRLLKIFFNILK